MNITITSITTTEDGNTMASFKSPAGTGTARWNSTDYHALVGCKYSVELDIDEMVLSGSTIVSATNNSFSLSEDDGEVMMTGMVDGIDDDGLFYFRLDPSCLIMISAIQDRPVSQHEWLTIKLESERLTMTPFGT